MNKPLFSVVLICRNEEKTIPRMAASLKEFMFRGGDVNIVDTGSTDNSVAVARSLGIRVKEVGGIYRHTIDEDLAKKINERFTIENEFPVVNPGETFFDFSSARNAAAAMADCDHVCTMDCDEVMTKMDIDFIDNIIATDAILAHFEYNFVFNHTPDGKPLVKFHQSKFYNRKRMEWQGIIHELVTPTMGGRRFFLGEEVFLLEHWQNHETDRTGYLRGLAVDCFNNPNSDRNSHYFARELWWTGRPYTAAKEFKRHVEMNRWAAERAESLLFMADIAGAMGGEDLPVPDIAMVKTDNLLPELNSKMTRDELKTLQIHYCHLAVQVEPNRREPLIKLAQIYSRRQQWTPANFYATAALELPWYPFYGANVGFYTNEPHELLYRAKGWLGDVAGAQKHLLICLDYQRENPAYLRDTQYYFDYPANNIPGWMAYKEQLFLFTTARRMESVIELGSWKGKSTHAICSSGCPKVLAIDTWKGSAFEPEAHAEAASGSVFEEFKNNTKQFKNLKWIQGDINDCVEMVGDQSVDMIFIDAGHTYEEVKNDIRKWKSKARILLCGHDYGYGWPGVIQAVSEELGGPDFVEYTIWGKWINKPLVSICIPTLGRPDKLNRLLESIKANAGYDNYEVIVKADEMPPNNVGAPTMLDRCVMESKGDLIMFLGNDCVMEPNCLQEAVWAMIRNFPEMDGLIALNDGYWKPDQGHVATHWLASTKLLPALGGEFFHSGFFHTGPDNELTARTQMMGKFAFAEKAKIFHDHPINTGFSWSDPLYEQAYAGPRHEADDALYKKRAEMYGFADRKWS